MFSRKIPTTSLIRSLTVFFGSSTNGWASRSWTVAGTFKAICLARASARAALQSIMGALVRSRNDLTAAAEIVLILGPSSEYPQKWPGRLPYSTTADAGRGFGEAAAGPPLPVGAGRDLIVVCCSGGR